MTPSLSGPQIVALSRELDDTVGLLQHGRTSLRDLDFVGRDSAAILVCLSSGAEKLLKLSLGLLSLERSGTWPSKRQMQRDWGHDLVAMDALARKELESRRHLSSARPYIEQLLEAVADDNVLKGILAALGQYAQAGRFHNLDSLAEEATRPSPQELWEGLEHELVMQDTTLLLRMADAAGGDDARKELNHLLDASVAVWQLLYFRAWEHGLFGEQAKRWSAQLSLMVQGDRL